jgi:superfamily I DNA/RNA helicase
MDGTYDKAFELIKTWAARLGNNPRSIAVLYPTKFVQPEKLVKRLEEEKLDVFWATPPYGKKEKDLIAQVKSPIVLSTIHSAKGLEFPNVLLWGLSKAPGNSEDNRKLVYVGMTRATHELAVVTDEQDVLVEDLRRADRV